MLELSDARCCDANHGLLWSIKDILRHMQHNYGFLPVCGVFFMAIHTHDDVIKWKHFPRYWPFVRGIHRSPVNSPHKDQWHGALMFFFYLRPNKRLSKQWWGWWFETPSCPLWCHCNEQSTNVLLGVKIYIDWNLLLSESSSSRETYTSIVH